MNKIFIYLGVAIAIIALLSLLQYVFDYQELSNYGKGFIWGKVILLFIGLTLTFIGRKRKKKSNPNHA